MIILYNSQINFVNNSTIVELRSSKGIIIRYHRQVGGAAWHSGEGF